MLAPAATSQIDPSASGPESTPVVLDMAGRRVELDRAEGVRLRAAAAAQAGTSSVARDLSVLLEHAIARGQVLALRRGEARTLARLATGLGLDELAQRLAGASRLGLPAAR